MVVFWKIEIKNFVQKEKLKELEKKFLKEDVFKDDLSFPKEFKIYYSKVKLSFSLIFIIGCLVGLIYLIIDKNFFKKQDSNSLIFIPFTGLLIFQYTMI